MTSISNSSDSNSSGLDFKAKSIHNGWLASARQVKSPHFNQRPSSSEISLLVIHNISLPPNQFGGPYIEDFFQGKLDASAHPYFQSIAALQVSAHLLIKRSGELVQFVSFNDRAWHAGQSHFKGRDNCNDFSIGIELEGADHIAYTDQQYQQLSAVTLLIQQHYPLVTVENIAGHNDIAPQRKTDPGESFDWQRFKQAL